MQPQNNVRSYIWTPRDQNKISIKCVLNMGNTIFLCCLQEELFENSTSKQLNDLILPRLLLIIQINNKINFDFRIFEV